MKQYTTWATNQTNEWNTENEQDQALKTRKGCKTGIIMWNILGIYRLDPEA